MLVSIVTPICNSEKYLAPTVESIISQSISDWELVLVDDCSTDNSGFIAQRYKDQDSRIRLIRLEQNYGAAVARNTAIEAAQGRYIAFLDSDDQWLPQKLEKQIIFMEKHNYAFTHSWYEKQDETGKPLGQKVCAPERLNYYDMLKSNQIGCLTACYDTDKLGKVFMPLIRKRQDYGLWLKILKKEPFVYCLPEFLALYRVRSSSVSSNKVEMLKYNWQLYRHIEKLSVLRSAYYLGWNIARKVLR